MIIYIGPTRFRRKRFKPMMVLKLQIQPLRIPCKSYRPLHIKQWCGTNYYKPSERPRRQLSSYDR